jgi:hypothetical protein
MAWRGDVSNRAHPQALILRADDGDITKERGLQQPLNPPFGG